MDNCKKRHLMRTVIGLYLLKSATHDHRKCWEWEKKRCKKANEDFIMDGYILGRITHIGNLAEGFAKEIVNRHKDLDMQDGNEELKIVRARIMDNLDRANCLAKDKSVCNLEEERYSKSLPPDFVYTWGGAWAIFLYLRDNYMKTLNNEKIRFDKLQKAIYKYHEFFLKDIMAIRGKVEF